MDTKLIILFVIVILIIIGLVVYFMFVHGSNEVIKRIKKTKNWNAGVMWEDTDKWVSMGKFIFEIKSDKELTIYSNLNRDGSMRGETMKYKKDGSDSIIIKIDGEKSAKMYIKDKYLVLADEDRELYLLPETNVE